MALARYERTVVDETGDILPGASIEVRREKPGQPLEPLFTDRDGLVPAGNPIAADANGKVSFHCRGGAFQIIATSGAFNDVRRYQAIGTYQEVDDDGLIGHYAWFQFG